MRLAPLMAGLLILAQPVLAAAPEPGTLIDAGQVQTKDYAARRERLYDRLQGGVALLVAAPEFFTAFRSHRYDPTYFPQEYKQELFFYYLSGLEEPGAALLIDGKNRRTTLYYRDTTPADQVGAVPFDAAKPRAQLVTDLAAIVGQRPTVYILLGEGDERIESGIMVDSQLPFPEGLRQPTNMQQDLRDALIARIPEIRIRNLDPIVADIRSIKDTGEISLMRQTGHMTAQAMLENIRSVRVGYKESELAGVSRFVCRQQGAQRIPYSEDIQGGESANLSYWTYFGSYDKHDQVLAEGDLLYIDTACEYNYYQGDMARTVPVNGRFTHEQKALYELYMTGYQAALDAIRPGATEADVSLALVNAMRRALPSLRAAYLRAGAQDIIDRYKTGVPLGHFVDMYVYGAGSPQEPLRPGQILTIEPSMFVKTKGLARITVEDLILVTKDGREILTDKVPRTVAGIEDVMTQPGILPWYKSHPNDKAPSRADGDLKGN